MKIPSIIRPSRVSLLTTLVLMSACADDPVATRPSPDAGFLTAEYECIVDVSAGTTSCQPVSPFGENLGLRLDLLIGTEYAIAVNTGGGAHWHSSPSNEDTTLVNVAVKNKMLQPIGTTDGTTADPAGNRVVFTNGPWVTAVYSGTITGTTVRLGNPDGTATFSDGVNIYSNKPYYSYVGVLAKDSVSASKPIWFVYSPTVKTFKYTYKIATPVQYEAGWLDVTPDAVPILEPGDVDSLTSTEYNQFSEVQNNPLNWSTSNSAVATVSASGVVTAVGPGTAMIKAVSSSFPVRADSVLITVDAAPTVSSTIPANGASQVSVGVSVKVTFSEPVHVSGASFTMYCGLDQQFFTVSGSGTSTATLYPVEDLPPQTTCTVNVLAAQVSDADATDGPDHPAADDAFSFTIAP